MSIDLDALKNACAHWSSELEKMRGELLRAERVFSEALEDQRARIAFAEEQLRVNMEAVAHYGEPRPLAEIIASLAKPATEVPRLAIDEESRSIIDGEESTSSKARRLTVYILERATKPLNNREIIAEYDRLGLRVGWTPEEVMRNEPHKSHTAKSAEARSFNLKWGLVRKAFDERVTREENNTYWLHNHPLGPASRLPR